MSGELVLIRHAETQWTLDGRHTGSTDIPLTDAGREAAAGLGPRLADRSFALVLCSPLSRARETCALAGFGDRAQYRDDLREFDYGDYEGLTTPEILAQRPAWSLWRDGCPGGETPDEVGVRADRVIAEAETADGDVALFGHGHILRILAARWIGLAGSGGGLLSYSAAALSVLGYEHDWHTVHKWNLTAGQA